jgi:chemotaxis protein methyltransferase CheR
MIERVMEPARLSTRQFELFREIIYRHSGIRMESSKITLVTNRLRRRLKANHLDDFDAYYKLITSPGGTGEMGSLLDAVTTNETSFFRTPQHFDWFQNSFVPETAAQAVKGARPKSIRVWSAACSSGEEPYSLAICLHESALRLRGWKLTILGTDISEAALQAARIAVYRRRSVATIDPRRLKRCFEPAEEGESFVLRPQLREMVELRRHNLLEPLRLPALDCIFVRNVLIYFDRGSKQTVIGHLIKSLAAGGYLVVGPSEGVYDMLDPLIKRSTFLYQKPA